MAKRKDYNRHKVISQQDFCLVLIFDIYLIYGRRQDMFGAATSNDVNGMKNINGMGTKPNQ